MGRRLRFETCVVGGGPAGAVSAAFLAKNGHSVALIAPGRQSFSDSRGPFGETLPPAAVLILEELVDREIEFESLGHQPWLCRRSKWASGPAYEHSSLFDLQGHGWRIDRSALEEQLLCLAEQSGATVLRGWRLTPAGVLRNLSRWQLRLRNQDQAQESLEAAFLIDATGRKACALRQVGGIGRRRTFDRLIAWSIAIPQRAEADEAASIIEAAPHGYWYSALGPKRRRVFSYFTDSDLVSAHEIRNPHSFFGLLIETQEISSLLAACQLETGRFDSETTPKLSSPQLRPWVLAATTSRRQEMVGEGWIALGDAAMTFDPICSQGIYTAMRTGLEAARAIVASSSAGASYFQEYVDRTWRHYLLSLSECYFMACPIYKSNNRSKRDSIFWRRRRPEKVLSWDLSDTDRAYPRNASRTRDVKAPSRSRAPGDEAPPSPPGQV